jgi:CBS domain-containing protein
MKIRDVMTENVRTIGPDVSLREAAQMLASLDTGILPVEEGDRLIGMVTDRDIVVRGVAKGCSPDAKVREVMSKNVKYAFDDDDVEEVTSNMAEIQVRRLPVVNRDKRLVGIVSLADIANAGKRTATGKALEGVTRPGGQHNQANGQARM